MIALDKLVPTDTSKPTVYKCGPSCPALTEEIDDSGVTVCKSCPTDATKKVYDISTGTCIAEGAGCPATTILTTLDKLPKSTDASALSFKGNHTEVKVCAPCNKRCLTCSAQDPNVCLTCATDLFASEITVPGTTAGTTTTVIKCEEKCKQGTFPNSDKVCSGQCLSNCYDCKTATTCDVCSPEFYKDAITDVASHTCVAANLCPAKSFADKHSGECQACSDKCGNCQGGPEKCITCPATKLFLGQHNK